MPLAKIEVRKSRPADEIADIMEAVYLAQCEALKVPEDDRQIRYIEHKPEHFASISHQPKPQSFADCC